MSGAPTEPDVHPGVSVVIPAYNAARFIAEAIESVLGQTLQPSEILLVDDASTDETPQIAAGFLGVRVIRQASNRGQAAALNRGIAESRGALLAFLDADDLWRPRKLELQCAAFDAEPSLEAVYGLVEERVLGGAAPAARDGRVLPAHLPSALLIRRAALGRVGPFDEQLRMGSVVDWYSRAQAAGLEHRVLDAIVYERRIHGANLSLVGARHRNEDYLGVVRAALARKRTQGAR